MKKFFKSLAEQEVIRFLGLTNHEDYLREKEKSQGGYRTYDRSIVAFIIVLKQDGSTIGRCGFHNWYSDHRKAEIGYIIFKESNRKMGYMKEALEAIISYGFNHMGLNRIEACISLSNEASLHLIRNHGFVKEGHLRQHYIRSGNIEDSYIFSLLKNEFDTTSNNSET